MQHGGVKQPGDGGGKADPREFRRRWRGGGLSSTGLDAVCRDASPIPLFRPLVDRALPNDT